MYGGMDGLVSIFVSVAVVASGSAPVSVLLVIAIAKLVAGSISMGMGDYLGTQADVDYAKGERAREAWEVEYYPEGEKREMVELYVAKGIPFEVATEVVNLLATNKNGFIDTMMVEELGIMPDTENEVPWKNVAVITVVTLFGMGVFKAKSTDTLWWKSGVSTVFFGSIGAFTGFITVAIIKWINPSIDING
eukprot:gene5241-6064_t